MDDDLYVRASTWFVKKGHASFRFNLYGPQKNARQLMECSLTTHADDLDTVVRFFRKKGVKKIFIVGHSFGGPVILASKKQDFDSVALWDPSYDLSFSRLGRGVRPPLYIKEIDGYALQCGTNFIISKHMLREVEQYPWRTVSKEFSPPLKVFIAGAGILHKAKAYAKKAHSERDFAIIKNASHDFDEPGTRTRLFEETCRWFKSP